MVWRWAPLLSHRHLLVPPVCSEHSESSDAAGEGSEEEGTDSRLLSSGLFDDGKVGGGDFGGDGLDGGLGLNGRREGLSAGGGDGERFVLDDGDFGVVSLAFA